MLPETENLFRKIVSAGFSQKRKTILNNLKNSPENLRTIIEIHGGAQKVLELAEIEPQHRAESLTIEEWKNLTRALTK